MKNNKLKSVLLLSQAILLLAIGVFLIVGQYSSVFNIVWQILVLIELAILILNNILIYKRKYMTVLYTLGFLLIMWYMFFRC